MKYFLLLCVFHYLEEMHFFLKIISPKQLHDLWYDASYLFQLPEKKTAGKDFICQVK